MSTFRHVNLSSCQLLVGFVAKFDSFCRLLQSFVSFANYFANFCPPFSTFVNYYNVTIHPCQQSCLLVCYLAILSSCQLVRLSICQPVGLSAFSLRILELASLFKSKSTLSQWVSQAVSEWVIKSPIELIWTARHCHQWHDVQTTSSSTNTLS